MIAARVGTRRVRLRALRLELLGVDRRRLSARRVRAEAGCQRHQVLVLLHLLLQLLPELRLNLLELLDGDDGLLEHGEESLRRLADQPIDLLDDADRLFIVLHLRLVYQDQLLEWSPVVPLLKLLRLLWEKATATDRIGTDLHLLYLRLVVSNVLCSVLHFSGASWDRLVNVVGVYSFLDLGH